MKKILGGVLVAASLLAMTAYAYPGHRWYRPGYGRINQGRTIEMGTATLGDYRGQPTFDVIYVNNNPSVQCNLTHIKMMALRDDLRVLRLEIMYRTGETDTINLGDDSYDRDPRYRHPGNGLYLSAYEETPWLDLDDVQDGYPNGRCVDQIRVYGYGIPDHWGSAHAASLRIQGLLIDRVPPPHYRPVPPPPPPRYRPVPPRDPRYRDPRYRDPRGPHHR